MASLLIAIIYLAFISLGLPDSLLGSAWPTMVIDLSAPLSYAGIISMIISGGTIVSSLLSDALTRKLGTSVVTTVSVFLTAAALLGFSFSGSFIALCVLAVPYGLGAGAIDAALNNYVALHYSSRHMSWLHCFWGVGALISPYVMGWAIGSGMGWRVGYGAISVIQLFVALVLAFSIPLWKKRNTDALDGSEPPYAPIGIRSAIKIKGVKAILVAFFGYCAFEATTMLWASTYLVEWRGVDATTAASFASLFYIGITAGRFLTGFVADRVGDKNMIRIGAGVLAIGFVLIALPLDTAVPSLVGLVAVGLGAAPVYPAIIHSTPEHFGKENSHAIVGIQMASAYTGSTLMPSLFGIIAQYVSVSLYPAFCAFFAALLIVMTERVNSVCKKTRL